MKSKSLMTFLVALSSVALTASADVSFKWSALANEALNSSGSALGGGKTVLTFLSTDSTINFDTSIALQSTYGNDFFVHADTTPAAPVGNGRYTTSTMTLGAAGNGAGSYVGYTAYFVLVDTAYFLGITPESIAIAAASATIKYGVSTAGSPTLNWYDNPSPQTPQVYDVGVVQTSQTVVGVPEPSTVALMLAGLGIVAMRMRRK